MKPFIGIKKIWYGSPLTTEPTVSTIASLISSFTEVKNSHDGTWGYTQDDPTTTEYKNELTGQTYYTDKQDEGKETITFTMGAYEFQDKATLQGGEVIKNSSEVVGWKSKSGGGVISKAVIGMTKTGHYIIFTNATIVAKADTQEKNIGLGVTAVASENENEGVAAVYFFDGSKISA